MFIIMTNDHPSNHLQSPDMHLTIFGMAHGMNRPGIDCILSLRLGRSRTKKSQTQTTNFSRLVDKQSYIIHATSSREEYANVVIDTIEQYAPGFRWSERQILECFHTCIANPHKSHSLKLRAGQASLARRFFPLLSWRGSLVLLEVHHPNHVQHIIKDFFHWMAHVQCNLVTFHIRQHFPRFHVSRSALHGKTHPYIGQVKWCWRWCRWW